MSFWKQGKADQLYLFKHILLMQTKSDIYFDKNNVTAKEPNYRKCMTL